LFLAVATATARPLASVTPTPTAWRLEGTGGRAPGSPAPSSQVAGAAVGRAGIRGVWQMAPAMVISRFTPLARSTPYLDALDLRPPSPSHAWRGSPSIRRADHGGSARFESLRSGQANPIQSNPIQGSHPLALGLHTSHVSTGWRGWGGGTIRRHGWRLMSPHGGVHGGSRHPTHGVPPRIELECSLCLCLCLRRSAFGLAQVEAATASAPAAR